MASGRAVYSPAARWGRVPIGRYPFVLAPRDRSPIRITGQSRNTLCGSRFYEEAPARLLESPAWRGFVRPQRMRDMSTNTCPREECNAEITESERVAYVDGEYPETATVGRYAATCANGHLESRMSPNRSETRCRATLGATDGRPADTVLVADGRNVDFCLPGGYRVSHHEHWFPIRRGTVS